MSWMDMVSIAIMIIISGHGYYKGFVISFINMASWIIASICSIKFYPVITNYLAAHTPIYSKICQILNDKVTAVSNISMGESSFDMSSFIRLPEVLEEALALPDVVSGNFVVNNMSEVIAKLLLDIISILIIFFIVKIALAIIAGILDKFTQLPIINQLNRLGGLLFGFIKGGIIIFVILALMVPITSIFPNEFIDQSIEDSTVTKYLYDHNLILTIFGHTVDTKLSE